MAPYNPQSLKSTRPGTKVTVSIRVSHSGPQFVTGFKTSLHWLSIGCRLLSKDCMGDQLGKMSLVPRNLPGKRRPGKFKNSFLIYLNVTNRWPTYSACPNTMSTLSPTSWGPGIAPYTSPVAQLGDYIYCFIRIIMVSGLALEGAKGYPWSYISLLLPPASSCFAVATCVSLHQSFVQMKHQDVLRIALEREGSQP